MEQETIQPNNTQTTAQTLTQKKSKASAIVLTFCVILALAGIGFGIYGMFFNKPDTSAGNNGGSSTISQENVPSVENITTLLSEKYKLFDTNGRQRVNGTILGDYVYGDDAEGFSETAKLFLVIKKEFPDSDADSHDSCRSFKTINYDELNNKYHEYFGNSTDIKKEGEHTYKHPWIGVDSVKYVDAENSFEVTYPGCLGGVSAADMYYTKIADVKRTNDGIVATGIVVRVNAGDAELISCGVDGCFTDPNINMDTLKVNASLYNYNFIEEDGIYKLTNITKQ